VVVAAGGKPAVTIVSVERLSRLVSHALRHEPWLYELELDDRGWTSVDALLTAIHEQGPQWSHVDRGDLMEMIASSTKRRHEIDGERVRALYGHSTPGRIAKVPAAPPAQLFHGTSPQAWATIQRDGLEPMHRQYVHLSTDSSSAEQVGRRKSATPVILVIDAQRAHDGGTRFWRGNDAVWLADAVAADYLSADPTVNEAHSSSTGADEGGADGRNGE
jgi:putative RNA 2'-phosphotransferase